MKLALVYDRVNKFGGAERVLLSLKKLFPTAPLYTLVHHQKTAKWASVFDVRPTFLNNISFLRNKHEILAPIAPLSFESLDLKNFDVIISVTSSDAKSIITRADQLHLCYCLTPTRYFWSGADEYRSDIKMRLLPAIFYKFFRYLDLVSSARPDVYISISKEIKNRVKNYYHRDSKVVYPPINDLFFEGKTCSRKRRYFLIAGRLVPYKKTELVVRAFKKLDYPLIVAGDGAERKRLESMAGSKTVFLGEVTDLKLRELYTNAIATIFPQCEDFGLIPIESQACGTPVIAYKKGGALETVVDGETGVFFRDQTEDSLISALEKLKTLKIDPRDCIKNAQKFSEENFLREFKLHFDKAYNDNISFSGLK